ncbi:alpha/beta hydrolase [Leptospira meyeri]|uniref:alpha/beta hydrolase n=1 Tax=Leptospira meyeri TaxID=29508 RepID=UPI0018C8CBB7|nr:alpha/beta fold hydrolase [Leptospira meyeri]
MNKKQTQQQLPRKQQILRKFGWFFFLLFCMIPVLVGIGIWSASNQILFPKWKGITKDFRECSLDGERVWGKSCGNLRLTKDKWFQEISIPSLNGYDLPGWFVPTRKNGISLHKGVVLFIHGGGSDRRELSRFIPFYLNQGFDVFSFDLSCHGEAPCLFPGLSFGNRESRDVLSAYLYLNKEYGNILMVGSSVGASSILIALPFLNGVKAVILENPMLSFERLIFDSPESNVLPKWMVETLIGLVMSRGKFDSLASPENSLPFARNVPLLIIHSRKDTVVPYQHSETLAKLYSGPSEVWFPDFGSHGFIWETNRSEYESRVRNFIRRNINQ